MRKPDFRSGAPIILTLALLASTPIVAQDAPRGEDLPNFHRVNDQLYRGAQPRGEGFRKLAVLGIKTVVNLRGADDRARAEEAAARATGLTYFNVPMHGLARPSDEQVAQVLEIINDPKNHPVFLHCKRGADRTGTIVAIYRITREEWTSARAKAEANRYGMKWTQIEMRGFISDYYRRHLRHRGIDADLHDHDLRADLNRFTTQTSIAAAASTRQLIERVQSHAVTRSG